MAQVLPELDAQLEAARKAYRESRRTSDGSANAYESRSALAVALAKRWAVDQVSAYKSDGTVTANYSLRVDDGVDLGFLKATVCTAHGALPRRAPPTVPPTRCTADLVPRVWLQVTIWPEGDGLKRDGFKTALVHSLHCDPALPLALAQYPPAISRGRRAKKPVLGFDTV